MDGSHVKEIDDYQHVVSNGKSFDIELIGSLNQNYRLPKSQRLSDFDSLEEPDTACDLEDEISTTIIVSKRARFFCLTLIVLLVMAHQISVFD